MPAVQAAAYDCRSTEVSAKLGSDNGWRNDFCEIDIVFAEAGLILSKAKTSEPAPDIDAIALASP